MTTVRTNSSIIKFGVITTCSALFAVKWTTADSDQCRNGKSDDGVEQRLTDNDLVNIAVGGAHRAQRGELVKMVFGAGIECLCDDDSADNDAEQRACNECRAGSCPEKPERPTLISELIRSKRLDAGNVRKNILTDLLDIGFRLQPNEKMTGKARRQSDVGPSVAKIGEYIGRRRERANAVRDRTNRYW